MEHTKVKEIEVFILQAFKQEWRFRILYQGVFSWLFLFAIFFGGSIVRGTITERFGELISALGFAIVVAMIYGAVIRFAPRWLAFETGGVRIGRTLYSFSEIECIEVEKSHRTIRVLLQRNRFPASVYLIKSERVRFFEVLPVWGMENAVEIRYIH